MNNHLPLGFTFSGIAAGIKKTGAGDLAVVVSERPCSAAAVFTRNAFPAAPVLYDRALLEENAGGMRAVAINAGCANACTGEAGLADAAEMAARAEASLGLPPRSCAVMSTGVIGPRLPMDKIAAGLGQAAGELASAGWEAAARAILTTDTRPKVAFREAGGARLFGMCKGAGMIHPNMATMLSVIVTDAAVEPTALAAMLRAAVDVSFNCISVDGDMSTNDTVLVLANGASGWTAGSENGSQTPAPTRGGRGCGVTLTNQMNADETLSSPALTSTALSVFASALTSLCTDLAQQIVRDGEGATKFITVRIEGAASNADAQVAAKAVANSPLVKTAFYGGDANWGRILAAVGYSGAAVAPTRADLWIAAGAGRGDALQLVRAGQPLAYSEDAASAIFAGPEITVMVALGLGAGQATVWTCDLSHDYVSINGHYRT